MGTREAGFASSLPGYRKFENAEDREELARCGRLHADRIPTARGLAYPDIIEAAVGQEDSRALDHRHESDCFFPNLDVLKQGLETLDFLVVQDGFHPTPTSELAHLVLPAAIWGEKEGTYTNSERRVSKVNRAVRSSRRSRSRISISFSRWRTSSAAARSSSPDGHVPSDAFEEWKRVSKGRLCDYSGMTYELIEEHGGIQWPFPEGTTGSRHDSALCGRAFSHRGRQGQAVLHRVGAISRAAKPASFRSCSNTGRTVEHWHTRTKTGQVPILERMSPNAWLEMNPRDAPRLCA